MKRNVFTIVLLVACIFAQAQPFSRIISLAPSLTKDLYYLEADDRLVGCTSYCEIAKPDNKEIVASAIKVNIEKLLSLEPDLVLATSITNQETIAMLKKCGVRVELYHNPKSFTELCSQFLEIAELVGAKDKGSDIIDDAKHQVDSIKQICNWETTPKIFFQIGADPLFAVIPNTFMHDYIEIIGGENIVKDSGKGTISRETVVMRNPDAIFIITMGVVAKKEKKTWTQYSELSAVKKQQVFTIDADMACTPTPVSFVETIKEMSRVLKVN